MRFWDASAIIAMVFNEPGSAAIHALMVEDPAIVVWWQTEIECASAFARKEREKRLPSKAFAVADDRLRQLAANWQEVAPSRELREIAKRLVGTHRSAQPTQRSSPPR